MPATARQKAAERPRRQRATREPSPAQEGRPAGFERPAWLPDDLARRCWIAAEGDPYLALDLALRLLRGELRLPAR